MKIDEIKITVTVVVYNGADHIADCLRSLLAQDFPRDRHEILVIDNGSTDGTQEIVRQLCNEHPHLRLIVNPRRGIAGSRQIALKESAYPFVAFTDADCIAPPFWLSELAEGFARYSLQLPELAAVGGANVPPQQGRFYEALAIFLDSYLGSRGSVQGRRFPADRPVPHLPTVNVMYHKAAVLAVGGFDVSLGNIGEDQDLSFRLQDAGRRLIYLAKPAVIHKMRSTLSDWLKNMFVYGRGRMILMRKHPHRIEATTAAPMLLVAALGLMPLAALHPIFFSPLCYFFAIFFVASAAALRRRKLCLLPRLLALYVGTHVAYGLGEWSALLEDLRTPSQIDREEQRS